MTNRADETGGIDGQEVGEPMTAANSPVTFDVALANATMILTEASRSTATADFINAKVAVADRWLRLAELVASHGSARQR